MNVLQQLHPLFDWDAALQNFGVALLVELPIYKDKGLGSSCKSPCLCFVGGEYLLDEAIEVRRPLVSLGVGLSSWVLIDLRDDEGDESQRLVKLRGRGFSPLP
jgi:hypothetical protein